jgi:hypothetical protein
MKSIVVLTILVFASFAFGFWAGHSQAKRSLSQEATGIRNGYLVEFVDFRNVKSADDAYLYATVLTDLRGGNTDDGLKLLEQSLDASLSSLDLLSDKQLASILYQKDLERARDYRLKYPWHSSYPTLDTNVQRVLSSIRWTR